MVFAVFSAHTMGTICGHCHDVLRNLWIVEEYGEPVYISIIRQHFLESLNPLTLSFIDQPLCVAGLETDILLYRESFELSAEKHH